MTKIPYIIEVAEDAGTCFWEHHSVPHSIKASARAEAQMNSHVLAVPSAATPSFPSAFHDAQNRLNFLHEPSAFNNTVSFPCIPLIITTKFKLIALSQWMAQQIYALTAHKKIWGLWKHERGLKIFFKTFFSSFRFFKMAGQNIIDLAKNSLSIAEK